LKVHLEALRNELSPLEQQKALIDDRAAKRTTFLVWAGLGKPIGSYCTNEI